jgi:hypothetical protein
MARHEMQLSRKELKYIITDDVALAVREFVRPYLEMDEFCVGKPNLSYAIHSLYLDSDNLDLFWHTINGNKNRYKLRVRFYDDKPTTPVFFEIKRRENDAIFKQRAAVRRAAVPVLLAGQLPDPTHLFAGKPKEIVALQNFCRLMMDIGAKPKSQVSYLREAWVSPHDNSVRVTLDRDVINMPKFEPVLSTHVDPLPPVFGKKVVLELKFTGRFPNWFGEMVRIFGCTQCGAAKYAMGIELNGKERFLSGASTSLKGKFASS